MYVILPLLLLIVILNALLWFGLKKIFAREPACKESNTPVSIVVAARNEQKNIRQLIKSLLIQNSPPSEVVIVNDYSDDLTFPIAEEACADAGSYKILNNYFPQGKKNALTAGIKETTSGYVLITDADCEPEKNWSALMKNKLDEGCDLVFGLAPFNNNDSITGRISCYENMRSFFLSVAACGYNLPYSAAARSFGFRKSSFENLNGYVNTMEVPFGDDGLLIREAVKAGMKINVVTNPDAFVFSNPKSAFSDYLLQRKRHTTTSLYYNSKIKRMLGLWHLVNIIPLLLLPAVVFNWLCCIPFIIKLTSDYTVVLTFQKKFGYKFNNFKIFYHQLIYEVLLIIHFFNAVTGKATWK